jgi:hypothetical protein
VESKLAIVFYGNSVLKFCFSKICLDRTKNNIKIEKLRIKNEDRKIVIFKLA